MPVGFRNAAGVDLEQLFDPDVVGDGPTAPFLRTAAGTPLRFAAISYGLKGPDVGYRTAAGVDVSNLWARGGSAQYRLPFDGQSVNASISGLSGESGIISASASIEIRPDGTYAGVARGRALQPAIVFSGTWLPAGESASNYQVRFVFGTQTGNASPAVNGAPDFVAVTSLRAASVTAQIEASVFGETAGGLPVRVEIRRIGQTSARLGDIGLAASAIGQV